MFGKATVELTKAWNTLMEIEDSLDVRAAAWQEGQAFAFDQNWLALAAKAQEEGAYSLNFVGKGFIAYSILLALIILVYLPSAFFNMRMLSRQIKSFMSSLSTMQDGQGFVKIYSVRLPPVLFSLAESCAAPVDLPPDVPRVLLHHRLP
jgi:hypothetical protein